MVFSRNNNIIFQKIQWKCDFCAVNATNNIKISKIYLLVTILWKFYTPKYTLILDKVICLYILFGAWGSFSLHQRLHLYYSKRQPKIYACIYMNKTTCNFQLLRNIHIFFLCCTFKVSWKFIGLLGLSATFGIEVPNVSEYLPKNTISR